MSQIRLTAARRLPAGHRFGIVDDQRSVPDLENAVCHHMPDRFAMGIHQIVERLRRHRACADQIARHIPP